jgi:thymidylate synthase
MTVSCFSGETVDDVMRGTMEEIIAHGRHINPSQGPCAEIIGVLLEITNPRARLSLTETRARPFSCLGEFCWYLAGSNELGFVEHYIPEYEQFSDAGRVIGGYGPRWFDWRGRNQVEVITNQLRGKPDSRQAVIQIFDSSDLVQKHKSVPCTCTLQFFIRERRLHMFTSMRSNDVYIGLPHDVFAFTMLQEIIARDLDVELGTYKHAVGSMHLYDRNRNAADRFLKEGWQPTKALMPPMPSGNPWSAIHLFLKAEESIRTGSTVELDQIGALGDYWADLIRLLQVFHFSKEGDVAKMQAVKESMVWTPYRAYIERRIAILQDRAE